MRFADLELGQGHTCGLTEEGLLLCWTHAPPSTVPEVQARSVSTDYFVTCAVDLDGLLQCWAHRELTPGSTALYEDAPTGEPTERVGVGREHACRLHADGTLSCWGSDDYGKATPPGGSGWVDVQGGVAHSCALDADGYVSCWGIDVGDSVDSYDGGQVTDAPDLRFRSLAVGAGHNCGVTPDDEIVCWGRNHAGECDVPEGL